MSELTVAQVARRVGLEGAGMAKLSAEVVRRTPAYTFSEAAHYLRIPVTTLHAWCVGQDYSSKGQSRRYQRIIRLDGTGREGLSFLNLVEAHVLVGLRRVHRLPLPKIRRALDWTSQKLELSRPLAEARFATDGVNFYIDHIAGTLPGREAAQLIQLRTAHSTR